MAHLKLKPKILTSFSTLFSFTFFFSDHSAVSATNIRQNDIAHVVKLKNALTPPPTDWSDNTDICQRSGVSCSFPNRPFIAEKAPDGYVSGIDLNSRSLTGTTPSGLNTLYLDYLDLHNNSLSGPLPSLASITSLANVSLDNNNFTSIPDGCFEGLTLLESLALSNNVNLAPWTIPNLTWSRNLNTLNLVATNLMGSLPEMFGSLLSLQTLLLSSNNLAGVLPNSFAWSKLAALHLDYQYYGLSGTIEALSSITDLSEVWLQGNLFEGPISDLSHCTNLKDLELSDYRLTGVVPKSLMRLPFLEKCSLEKQLFAGSYACCHGCACDFW